MVAQPLTHTGSDTRQASAMPSAADDGAARVGGKRLRGVPEEEMPPAAAAAAAQTTGDPTIKDLAARVAPP